MITATITTATTTGARDHARAQASAHTDSMPVVPARDWPTPPVGVDAERLTWAETVPGGRYTSKILARGTESDCATSTALLARTCCCGAPTHRGSG